MFEIEGCIEITSDKLDNLISDDFIVDEFLEFIVSHGWSFGGGIHGIEEFHGIKEFHEIKEVVEETQNEPLENAKRQENLRGRIKMLEAYIWAQEHSKEVLQLMENALNISDARDKLMNQYDFTDNQAAAIIDMRNRAFIMECKHEVKEELLQLLKKYQSEEEK